MADEETIPPFTGGNLLESITITTIVSEVLARAGPIVKATLGVDLNILIVVFIAGSVILTTWNRAEEIIRGYLYAYYTCSFRVQSCDPMFGALMEFLEEHDVFTPENDLKAKAERERSEKEKDLKKAEKKQRRKSKYSADTTVGTNVGSLKSAGPSSISREGVAWYSTTTRNFDAHMDGWVSLSYYDSTSDSEIEADSIDVDNPYMKSKKKVKYSPRPDHSQYFVYKPTGHTVTVVREVQPENNSGWWRRPQESVTLSIYGRSPAPLQQLLLEVCDRENKKDVGRTLVYKASNSDGYDWQRCFSRAVRPMETVILDDEKKNAICEDIREYLLPATSRWYANRGLPYRRGYLLYGPPGTGKTSLTVALAGKFGLQVYSLSLSSSWMSDDILADLFSRLPKTCIVLIEDIDACGVMRESDSASSANKKADSSGSGGTPEQKLNSDGTEITPGKCVTFSGLLNAIDGVASKEGRVLIMTTNYRDRLDSALVRPGRVDMQLEFDYATTETVRDLFEALYNVDEDVRELLKFPKDFPNEDELEVLSVKFASMVPSGKFSPAEVQGFLLGFKKEPRKAVEEVGGFFEKVMAVRREKEQREMEEKTKERLEREKEGETKEREEREAKELEEQQRKEREKRIEARRDEDSYGSSESEDSEKERERRRGAKARRKARRERREKEKREKQKSEDMKTMVNGDGGKKDPRENTVVANGDAA